MTAAPAGTVSTILRPERVYYPTLDSVRALAAFAIVFLHVAARTRAFEGTTLGNLLAHGDVGVPVFYVLSGFLLYHTFAAAHFDGRPAPSVPRFYWRRFLRILPAYWLVLTVTIVVFDNVSANSPALFLRHYLLLDSYSRDWVRNDRWMVQSWSLATEIAFYALLPVLAFAIGALARRTRNVMASELGVCAALVALGIGVNGWLARSRPEGTVASVWLPAQIHLFALGMLLAVAAAWALHRGGDAALERLARPAWLWWTVAALAYWCVAVELHLPTSFDQPTSFGKAVAKTVLYAVVAFCVVAPCALMGDGPGRLRRFLSWRTARGLGLISYGIFLWHLDVIRELEDHGVFSVTSPITGAGTFDPAGDGARFLLVCAWTVALTIALAAIMWRLLERPLQRLAHSRPKRSPTA